MKSASPIALAQHLDEADNRSLQNLILSALVAASNTTERWSMLIASTSIVLRARASSFHSETVRFSRPRQFFTTHVTRLRCPSSKSDTSPMSALPPPSAAPCAWHILCSSDRTFLCDCGSDFLATLLVFLRKLSTCSWLHQIIALSSSVICEAAGTSSNGKISAQQESSSPANRTSRCRMVVVEVDASDGERLREERLLPFEPWLLWLRLLPLVLRVLAVLMDVLLVLQSSSHSAKFLPLPLLLQCIRRCGVILKCCASVVGATPTDEFVAVVPDEFMCDDDVAAAAAVVGERKNWMLSEEDGSVCVAIMLREVERVCACLFDKLACL
mmetsp:Transcript_22166/g.62924  ORF Transcript_22166/g.62924 Transcript_22166/m.62924 type:complete len:328 (+) Transcript_22166:228-1211(+)